MFRNKVRRRPHPLHRFNSPIWGDNKYLFAGCVDEWSFSMSTGFSQCLPLPSVNDPGSTRFRTWTWDLLGAWSNALLYS